MKKFKKFLALALSASMVMGMTLTSMAAEPEVSVDAPIYIYDITNIVVPTTFAVGFNPDQLAVTKGSETVNDQIVAKNYGIINKSTKDKIITVTLKVEDLNDGKINFVSKEYIENDTSKDYAINLQVVPAAGEVTIGDAAADLDTTGADLGNVTMTLADSAAKDLMAGENEIEFLLEKAKFTGSINIDTQKTNDVNSSFTPSGLADNSKGITAFTFTGAMNANADWSKFTKAIKITAVYGNENASSDAANLVVSGTGAMYVNPNPVFKTGAEVGTVEYKAGTGDTELQSITKIEMDFNGKYYDVYHELSGTWGAAVNKDGKITLSKDCIAAFVKKYSADSVREAIITYETATETGTATVDIRLKEAEKVSFAMGSEVGTINYTVGSGNSAISSISSIKMDFNGKDYDVYHELSGTWTAATDANGKITLSQQCIKSYADKYETDSTRTAKVTYVTVGGSTETVTVNIKLR